MDTDSTRLIRHPAEREPVQGEQDSRVRVGWLTFRSLEYVWLRERLVQCQSARRAVGRLLVCDPVRRATVRELWMDKYMGGEPVQGRLIDPII